MKKFNTINMAPNDYIRFHYFSIWSRYRRSDTSDTISFIRVRPHSENPYGKAPTLYNQEGVRLAPTLALPRGEGMRQNCLGTIKTKLNKQNHKHKKNKTNIVGCIQCTNNLKKITTRQTNNITKHKP